MAAKEKKSSETSQAVTYMHHTHHMGTVEAQQLWLWMVNLNPGTTNLSLLDPQCHRPWSVHQADGEELALPKANWWLPPLPYVCEMQRGLADWYIHTVHVRHLHMWKEVIFQTNRLHYFLLWIQTKDCGKKQKPVPNYRLCYVQHGWYATHQQQHLV